MPNHFNVELTDTFGGEANYCWVRRARVPADAQGEQHNARHYQRTIMRRAKAAVGMSGVRGITESYGDGFTFRPYGMCQIMFVNFDYS